jgi:GMP synthase (glutamine-hydrolysing)
MMRVLILQHTPTNPAGIYRDVVEERGAVPTVVELDQGDPVPDWTGFEAMVVMGGDMGVNDADAFPWLREEMRMIREAVGAGMPYWGVCLGGQLLAASLGGRVDRLGETEVGFPLIRLSESAGRDPVFGRLPGPLHAFVWHDDAFSLPQGAVLLGGTPQAHQAFRIGDHAYGVQFHLEATVEMVSGWMREESRASLERRLGPGAPERLLEELGRRQEEQALSDRILAEAWLDRVAGTGAAATRARVSPGRPD